MEHIAPNESTTMLKRVTDSVVETRDELKARRHASHQRRSASIRNLKRRRQDGGCGRRGGGTVGDKLTPPSYSQMPKHHRDTNWGETWRHLEDHGDGDGDGRYARRHCSSSRKRESYARSRQDDNDRSTRPYGTRC